MTSITVIRPVLVKTIVTESFKDLYRRELEEALRRAEEVLNQIDTQLRRMELERQASPQSRAIRRQMEVDRSRQEVMRAELHDRLREAQTLVLNSEFPQTTLDSHVEIRLGDNLFSKLTRTEIVVKDGIVMEIRQE
jgi:hypothetical protein